MPAAVNFLMSSLVTWAEAARGRPARRARVMAKVFMGFSSPDGRRYKLYDPDGILLPLDPRLQSSLGPECLNPLSASFRRWTALNIRDLTVPTGMPRISEISAYLKPLYSESRSTSRSPSGS